jgi:hypothetical protein
MLKVLKQAKAAFSLLSADEIQKQAERPIHFGLVADGSAAYAEMEELLVPSTLPRPEWRERMGQVHRANDPDVISSVDIVLYEPGLPCPVGSYSLNRSHPEATWSEILSDKTDLDLALARQYPAFRRLVVDRIIHMVSRENTLFAVATALPNVVPSLIELPWTFGEFASDTAFLTANQVRMAFQIAAACGKDVGLSKQKGAVLTIAAGAFGWRDRLRRYLSGRQGFGIPPRTRRRTHCRTARTALSGGPRARPKLYENGTSEGQSGVNLSTVSRVVQCT